MNKAMYEQLRNYHTLYGKDYFGSKTLIFRLEIHTKYGTFVGFFNGKDDFINADDGSCCFRFSTQNTTLYIDINDILFFNPYDVIEFDDMLKWRDNKIQEVENSMGFKIPKQDK